MPEYRIKVARVTIEEFIVVTSGAERLLVAWPDMIGVADAVVSYSDGDELLSYTNEDTGEIVTVKDTAF